MKFTLPVVVLLFSACLVRAQEADTVKRELEHVVITGYLSRQPIVQVPASVAVLDSLSLSRGSRQSLIPVVNTIPGVRMEERSPGSYRLSIRGSLLRSPFGIRNVKVYFNDLPLTDASGNTYLNLVDPSMLQRVEILKGPDGSLFGANSGGVVLLESQLRDSLSLHGEASGGSYGVFRQHVNAGDATEKFQWNFTEAFQRSDGYREQSAMKRLSLLGSARLRYGTANSVKLTMLFSDLHYETPGGLTKAQFEANPEQARPAGLFPGAVTQRTGIYNTTFFGGLTNELKFALNFRWVYSLFGTVTNYKNPFITNYEIRKERNGGVRTFLEYAFTNDQVSMTVHAGGEVQIGSQEIANYENNGGTKGLPTSSDAITIATPVYFSKVMLDIADRLTLELAAGLSQYQYSFNDTGTRNRAYEWMPRAAVSYRFAPELAVRGSISRGYSPPTVAEIRPSGAMINTTLEAESGWNKEIGTRMSMLNGRLQLDASVFRYNLTHAIVRRTNPDDTEFFLNSGGTTQTGVELLLNGTLIPHRASGFVRSMSVNAGYTYSRFRFKNYEVGAEDYSGNRLTGVPANNWVTGFSIDLMKRITVFTQALLVSRLPLNDANSAYAEKYELLQARVGWNVPAGERLLMELFVGGDNLLNQSYSLGNDLNAAGSRYYNAAPLRNYYGGLRVTLR